MGLLTQVLAGAKPMTPEAERRAHVVLHDMGSDNTGRQSMPSKETVALILKWARKHKAEFKAGEVFPHVPVSKRMVYESLKLLHARGNLNLRNNGATKFWSLA